MPGDEKAGPPAVSGSGNYDLSRLNAVRHAVLSKHTVLPWESREAYKQLLSTLCEEHHPEGETEYYLIEQLADIMWRKKRLRLAEIALIYETQKHITDGPAGSALNLVIEHRPVAVAAFGELDERERFRYLAELTAYEDQIQSAIQVLTSSRGRKTFEVGFAELPNHAREWWGNRVDPMAPLQLLDSVNAPTVENLLVFLKTVVLPWCERCREAIEERSMVNARTMERTFNSHELEKLDRYEVALDRRFERTLAMLLKMQELRRQKAG